MLVTSLERADALVEEGKVPDGLHLAAVAIALYPDDPRSQALLQTGYDAKVYNRALGYNVGRRVPRTSPTVLRRILFYLPDRVLDLVDVFSLRISAGPQLGVRTHVTHALQADLYAGTTLGAAIGQKHFVGIDGETAVEVGLGPVGPEAFAGFKMGTNLDGGVGLSVLQLPTNQIYQNYRDYWEIGGGFGFLVIGADAAVHPVEVVDFLAGLIGLDLLRDDLGATKRLQLRGADRQLYLDLAKRMRKGRLRRFVREHPELPPSAVAPPAEEAQAIDTASDGEEATATDPAPEAGEAPADDAAQPGDEQ
jgi:hypothetical protein